jgi:hypothetical protein
MRELDNQVAECIINRPKKGGTQYPGKMKVDNIFTLEK